MRKLKYLTTGLLTLTFLAGPCVLAADQKADAKAKPYPLKTCIVSGEKLGEMGDPYVFTHEGREIKLCCKNCLKDFNKAPANYIKKLDEAAAKEKKKEKS
jgi:hypothetical protein